MPGEIDLYGVFLPALLVYAVLALVLKELASRLLVRIGAYRFVWHRPLFDLALFVLLLGGITALAARI
ncbi:DUF1656 domain-containing protein [Geminicoccus harenae]|uniref:DUF1656 domain-containing protein n=1 Tax=Geminicoccus harenae TaxID=2498453 RepID=UPI00168BFFCF|nr:DUF1656 domain-containing protein [Geminicoccus harenae]